MPPDHRQWIREVLSHREVPVPLNLMLSPPAERKLAEHLGVSDVTDALGLPIRFGGPWSRKPLYADPRTYGETITDEFGVTWSTSEIDRGAPVGPCLTEPSLDGYRFPDPSDPRRFQSLGDWCGANREHFTILVVGDLWERATFMRGMEEILLDLALHRPFVRALLRELADGILRTMEILFASFQFDAIMISDDYGIQRSLVMSPADWRELIKPLLREIYGFARSHGRTTFHHTCGHVTPIVPDLIEVGLDILHPIQPETMDILALKREFGRDITFCGGLGTQELLPRGTPDQVRAEVRRLKETMGKGGGYILEPGITLQADVPLANMVAMVEEATAVG